MIQKLDDHTNVAEGALRKLSLRICRGRTHDKRRARVAACGGHWTTSIGQITSADALHQSKLFKRGVMKV